MSRIIREHHVYGREVRVVAETEAEAIVNLRMQTQDQIWEVQRVADTKNVWAIYVSKPEDAFACND
jgi:hypothetical protein